LGQGKRQYTLVYGEHNIAAGAQQVSFEFDGADGESTLAETTTMVALSLNSTHAVMILQVRARTSLLYRFAYSQRWFDCDYAVVKW
jgi:hypothetical protein